MSFPARPFGARYHGTGDASLYPLRPNAASAAVVRLPPSYSRIAPSRRYKMVGYAVTRNLLSSALCFGPFTRATATSPASSFASDCHVGTSALQCLRVTGVRVRVGRLGEARRVRG